MKNSKKKLKILLLITGMKSGGAERVMANLANELSNFGHKIRIVVMKNNQSDYKINSKIEFVGANAVKDDGGYNAFKGFNFYIKQIKQYKPDIIVSFLPKTNIFAVIGRLFFFRKTPVIVAERANPASRKGIIKVLNDFLFPKADGCCFQTCEAQAYYNLERNKKACVLKNPVSKDFCVEEHKGERKKVIVTAGRLSKQKNHQLLLEAFAKVAHKYKDYKLIIYGDGELMSSLKAKSNELGIGKQVELPGRVNNVVEKIYDAALFVLSSDFEGMPNSLLEAMCLGVPVVATDCPPGGVRMLIRNNENGIIVSVGSVDSLSKAIDKVLSDRDFSNMISKNAHKIYSEYESRLVAREWEDFIYKIYNNFFNKNK